jgi:hypothetical protein
MERRTVSPVMPTTGSSARWQAPVGIHDFAGGLDASRGWRAFARHDGVGIAVARLDAVVC